MPSLASESRIMCHATELGLITLPSNPWNGLSALNIRNPATTVEKVRRLAWEFR